MYLFIYLQIDTLLYIRDSFMYIYVNMKSMQSLCTFIYIRVYISKAIAGIY